MPGYDDPDDPGYGVAGRIVGHSGYHLNTDALAEGFRRERLKREASEEYRRKQKAEEAEEAQKTALETKVKPVLPKKGITLGGFLKFAFKATVVTATAAAVVTELAKEVSNLDAVKAARLAHALRKNQE